MFAPPLIAQAEPLTGPPVVAPDLAGVTELVRWAANAPLRGRWSPERVAAGYCARSPAEILAEGTLPWTAPCADLSSLVALGLVQAGLAPTLVLTGIRRPLRPVKFQCGLELELEGRTHVIGFGLSCAWFYPGRFVETAHRPWIARRPLVERDPERSFLSWFEPEGRAGLAARFPGYELGRDLAVHQRQGASLARYWLARWKSRRAPRPGRVAGAGGRWA